MSRSGTSRPIAAEARSPHAYISSSSARSRSDVGAVPIGCESSLATSSRLRTFGRRRPRRGPRIEEGGALPAGTRYRSGRVALAETLAAQVPVEGAQAGGLAVDRGRRGRRAAVALGELG